MVRFLLYEPVLDTGYMGSMNNTTDKSDHPTPAN
jgi:hypothetical protein